MKTLRETADAAGVIEKTLWNWRSAGLVPQPKKQGKSSLYTEAQFKRIVAFARNRAAARRSVSEKLQGRYR